MRGSGRRVLAAGALLALLAARADAGEAPSGTYRYVVRHPTFGSIGSFVNTVSRHAGETRVATEMHIAVKAAIITLKSITARREEVWRGGRLVGYRSLTNRDGTLLDVEGRAAGDKFVVHGPGGIEEAPADVYPSNPWSIAITGAHVFVGGESGRLYHADFVEMPPQQVTLGGRAVTTRHFIADSKSRPQLWFAGDDLLVQFSFRENGTEILCTLDEVRVAGGG
jgi:hypothetical protein